MNEGREGHVSVTLNNRIYAIGGYRKATVEMYDPSTNRWTYVKSTNARHYFGSATIHKNKIYAISLDDFEVYEPATNTWTNLKKPAVGWGAQLVSTNDRLLLIGGAKDYTTERPNKQILEYDVSLNTWTQLYDMDVDRKNFRALVL